MPYPPKPNEIHLLMEVYHMFLYGLRATLSDEGLVAEEMRQHHMTIDELDDYYWKEDRSEENA